MQQHIKVDDQILLKVKRIGINGEGIGYNERLAIFVDGILPEEEAIVKIRDVFENRATAELIEIKKKSPLRREPFCPIYETCGGCQMQHMTYEATLKYKKEMIIQTFERYLNQKIDPNIVKDTKPSPKDKHYRNKASLPVQNIRNKNYFGMYAKNSNQFIPIEDCPIQDEKINHIFRTIIKLMETYQMDAYNTKTQKGFVRNVVIRMTEHQKEAQVSMIMLRKSNRIDQFAKDLVKKEPSVKSVYEVLNKDFKTPGYFTDEIRLVQGLETIKEKLNDQDYLLLPEAFFQLNTLQADSFYQEMKRLANLKKHEIAIDAYSGIAPVSHYVHADAHKIYAIEIDPRSCESAKKSLKENGIDNVVVLQSDFKRALSGLREKKIDVMFFDPPRTGLGHETIQLILKFKPSRLVYGSCNPSTLAKDINLLTSLYDLIETVPLDMFPYTSHIESISLLQLKSQK